MAPGKPLVSILSILLIATILPSVGIENASAQAGGYVAVDTWSSQAGEAVADAWPYTTGIDATLDGRIILADRGERRLILIPKDGEPSVLASGAAADLREPGHLAVDADADSIYVSDPPKNEVAVFDLQGARKATWPNIQEPAGIAVLPDGNVVVASAGTGELLTYSPDGIRLLAFRVLAPNPPSQLLAGVDVDRDGRIYVLDGRSNKLYLYNQAGGRINTVSVNVPGATLRDIAIEERSAGAPRPPRYLVSSNRGLHTYSAEPGSVWERLGLPTAWGVAVNQSVGIVAAVPADDSVGSRVALLPWGAGITMPPTRWWGKALVNAGSLVGPEIVSVGADGAAYVLDRADRIQRFTIDHAPADQLMPAQLPIAVDADAGGRVFTTSGYNIRAFDKVDGEWQELWNDTVAPAMREGSQGVDLAYSSARGQVVVLDAGTDRLRFFGPDGTRPGEATLRGGQEPVWSDLAEDAAGTLYALDRSTGRVVVHRMDGQQQAIDLPNSARHLAAGEADTLYTLDRDGWVRRFSVDPGAGSMRRTSAFDATRFDISQASSPSDLGVTPEGEIFVVDREANTITRFAWDPSASSAEPPLDPGNCRVYPDKTAAPGQVNLQDPVTVQLTLRGGCGSEVTGAPRDIIMVLDVSASMAGENINTLREAALNFVAEVDFKKSRVGVVTFTANARIASGLSSDSEAVRRTIRDLDAFADGGTAVDAGLDAARTHWRSRQRNGVQPVFILISDGGTNAGAAVRAADEAKDLGIEIFSIAVGPLSNFMLMTNLATDPSHAFQAVSARFLYGIFEQIADRVTATTLFKTVTLTDEVPAGMRYVAGSAQPPALYDAQTRELSWTFADVPPSGFSIRYLLEPQVAGPDLPTNVVAWADYVDGFDKNGRADFPVPRITVIDPRGPSPTPTNTFTPSPTSTATPTVTPTPSPTKVPVPIFIPLILKEKKCLDNQRVDVMLVLDTSNSMVGEKLAAAKAAAKSFVQQLNLPEDQAGIVGFSTQATLAHELSGDAAALEAAIDGLTTDAGTRMDRGLELALAELQSDRHKEGSTPAIVLLTDGQQDEEPERAQAIARQARSALIPVYAIGLGDNVDRAFLVSLTGQASRTFLAPSPSELVGIYEQIAVEVPCPPEVYWGKR